MNAQDKPQCCIRIDPVLYKKIKIRCIENDITINQFVLDAVNEKVKKGDKIILA